MSKLLSKSKLMLGLQCHKNLWLTLNEPELSSEIDMATQLQFDEGNEVGELARTYFKNGILIDGSPRDFEGTVRKTKEAIKNHSKVIFEASFKTDNYYARADILKKTSKGWELIEVKKSTGVKDYHINDVGIQSLIIEESGLKLEKIKLMHINTNCEYPVLKDLFTIEDITDLVRESRKELKIKLKEVLQESKKRKCPNIEIGPQCSEPFDCGFKDHCWKHIPKPSVFNLPGIRAEKAWGLYSEGIVDISNLDSEEFNGNIKRAIEVTQSGKMYKDSLSIENEVSNWKFPLYFLDFETINPAVPRYKGTKPYSQVPFQFSCHVLNRKGDSKLSHFEYLHVDATDPRPELIKNLIEGIGNKGSIVAYNMSFEKNVIKKLSEFDKKNSKKLLSLIDRFVDPLQIFRSYVYHPKFNGSFSIKAVGPALIGSKLKYDKLEVGDGATAQAVAEKILRGRISSSDKEEAIKNLLEYCRQDTIAMVEIVKWLMK